jgi:superfamily I DNA/RNA helicase
MIFIDVIQDFDNHFLGIAKRLCRSNRFFFVGDIWQKIYERRHDLAEAGFPLKHAHLPKHYRMYRTPRYVGELASRFILDDPVVRDEFKENGYEEKAVCKNELDNAAELLRAEDSERAIVERVQNLLNATYTADDVMIITEETHWETMEHALDAAHIRHSRIQKDGCVIVVDFMHCKGLEREVVFVTHIEALYERRQQSSLFDDADRRIERERYSLRKIYVALTRSLEQLIVYYTDPNNRFISQLLRLNAEIDNKRRQQIRS